VGIDDGLLSLQFLLSRFALVLPPPNQWLQLLYEARNTDEWVTEHFPPTDRFAPELAPGDALIFDHLTLHRTQPSDRETIWRMSIECRVTRHPAYLVLSHPSSWPPSKSPPQP